MISDVKIHPAAEIFPMMGDEEYKTLLNDMKVHGVRSQLIFLQTDGEQVLLDGRNRLKAIQELGLDYSRFKLVVNSKLVTDPIGYVLSLNLHRRHLDVSQRAMVADKVAKLRRGDNQHAQICASTSQDDAAKALNVGKRSVQQARQVSEKAVPAIVNAVEKGAVSVSAAATVAKLPKAEQKKLMKEGPKAVAKAASEKRKADKPKAETEPERKSQFDPEEIEGTKKSDDSKSIDDCKKAVALVDKHLMALSDGLGPLVRAFDGCQNQINCHKHLVENYRVLTRQVDAAKKTFALIHSAWNKATK